MNRYNFGNVVTNGVQTLSVAGFTGSNWAEGRKRQKLADASSALNNLVDTSDMKPNEAFNAQLDAAKQVGEMRASKLQSELDEFQENQSGIDDLIKDSSMVGEKQSKQKDPWEYLNSPQGEELRTAINERVSRFKFYTRDGSRFKKIEDIVSELNKGGNK